MYTVFDYDGETVTVTDDRAEAVHLADSYRGFATDPEGNVLAAHYGLLGG